MRLPLVVCVKEQPIKLDSVVLKKQLCVGETIGSTSEYVTKIKKKCFWDTVILYKLYLDNHNKDFPG